MSASGTNTHRYGTIKNHILSMTIVLADGTIINTRNRPRKSSAGYDLNHLIIGSEGTLALVTEAVLKLSPLPKNLHVGLVVFKGLEDAVAASGSVMREGVILEAVEVVDSEGMRAINRSGLTSPGLTFTESATLFLKLAGELRSVQDAISIIEIVSREHGAQTVEFSGDKERIEAIWGARKCLGHALAKMKEKDSDVFVHSDAAVPVSKMATLIEESEKIVRDKGGKWFCSSMGHVGDGNIPSSPLHPNHISQSNSRQETSTQPSSAPKNQKPKQKNCSTKFGS